MTQAKGHLSSESVNSSLTRRAALIGLAAVATPATAGAVCVAPAETADPIFSRRSKPINAASPIAAARDYIKRGA